MWKACPTRKSVGELDVARRKVHAVRRGRARRAPSFGYPVYMPESYLTALVQTRRALNWPLDKATSSTKVTEYTESAMPPAKLEHGTYIKGLYLEGAGWDKEKMCLKRQEPKVLVVPLPILEMIPSGGAVKLHGVFVTPVYVTQDRRNAMGVGLVFEANLATDEHTSLWVLQGVALALNTDA